MEPTAPIERTTMSTAHRLGELLAPLRLPAVAAPMTGVSTPALVAAACAAGVIGSFPTSNAPTEATSSATDTKASPFGAARPADTAARDAAVAEKRAAAKQAKDEEDKARIEKEKADKAARAEEKKARGESVPSTPTASGHQENGSKGKANGEQNGDKKEDKRQGAQFEILRRMNDDGETEMGKTYRISYF